MPIVIIPARLESSRLPGKVLLPIAGKPMVLHVMERAMASAVGPVWVATDSPEVLACITAAGGSCVMTSPDHKSGTDRIHEAVQKIIEDERHPNY